MTLAALTFFFVLAFSSSAWALPDYDGDGSLPPADCNNLDGSIAPGKPDKPDTNFVDSNCDGIDGDESKAVFVAPSGSNAASGTRANPVLTITQGLVLADAATPKKDVYIAGGTYNGAVPLRDNIGLYGGYAPITGTRSTTEVTTINGTPNALLADDDQGVVLQLLTLRGTADASRSAYGLRAVSGSTIVMDKVTSSAGNGSNGGNGAAAAVGAPGDPGTVPDCLIDGKGAGGSPVGAPGGPGGGGGTAPFIFYDGSGAPGAAGTAVTGGGTAGGAGAAGGNASTGGAGGEGGPGGVGSAGNQATNGLTGAAFGFTGLSGSTGGRGRPGGGGGGGGGGGHTDFGFFGVNGAGGGGGGGGGEGGEGGRGGSAGGGSFAAYVISSRLTAINSTLTSGNGGTGGNGSGGAAGGAGGPGGAYGPFSFCFFEKIGGNGGNGGNGGAGGGGGGGAGGPSAGVMTGGASSSYTDKSSTETPGTAGVGGNRGGTTTKAASGQAGGRLLANGASTSSHGDFDADGKNDSVDQCPTEASAAANGCPDRPAALADNDGDEIPNGNDACPDTQRGPNDANEDGCPDAVDNDGDGFPSTVDCNDGSSRINPAAVDTADNGVDENCDGSDAVNLDRDGDGFQRPGDCNDGNGAIRPGVTDVPDNGVDENCDGSDAISPRLPTIASTVSFNFPSVGRRFTRFTNFQVKNVPSGSTITARCRKCGKKAPKQSKKNARGTVRLKKFQKKIKAGAIIEVRVTKPGFIGIVKLITVRKGKNPVIATRCLPPGTSRPVACS